MKTSPQTWAAAAVVALALVIALARLHTYDEPLERDITSAAVIGHELLAGRSLYADMWDHKPPAIHVSHAVAILLVGYGPGAVYLLNVTAAIITLVGVYVAASAVGGIAAGLWGAVFWTLVSGDLWLQANQPNAEAFINVCVVWAFVLFIRAGGRLPLWHVLTIGGLFAIASLYKPIAAASAAFLALAHIAVPPPGGSRRRALADALTIGGVGAGAWLATAAYFAARGHFLDFYQAVFAYNRFYSSRYMHDDYTLSSQSMRDILINSLLPDTLFPSVAAVAAPLAVFTLAGAVRGAIAGKRRPWLLLLGLAVGTHLAVALPGQWRPHYYQLWLPLLAVGAGWAVGSALTTGSIPRWVPSAIASAAVVLLVAQQVPLYRIPAEAWPRLKYGDDVFPLEQQLGRELRVLLGPGETFYEWGAEPGLYFESLHSPPSGAFYVYPLLEGPVSLQLTERAVRDLDRHAPTMFVIHKRFSFDGRLRHPVLDWAQSRYVVMAGDDNRGAFVVLVRRGSRLDVTPR
ncbi:MAG TPA: hypothetical protein VJZ73_09955 [Methylomirabilota bacterium]|nr:hypothetical protein [Methylomirabilota bacterium]